MMMYLANFRQKFSAGNPAEGVGRVGAWRGGRGQLAPPPDCRRSNYTTICVGGAALTIRQAVPRRRQVRARVCVRRH